jgi:hypothetical protein
MLGGVTFSEELDVRGKADAAWAPNTARTDSAPIPANVLVIGTDEWAIEQGARALEAKGHRVLRCHEPGEPAFPCNALLEGRTCPLDAGFDVVVTVRGRPGPSPTFSEFGAICAMHDGLPLVVAGLSELNPFAAWAERTVAIDGDIVVACEEVAAKHRSPEDPGSVDLRSHA